MCDKIKCTECEWEGTTEEAVEIENPPVQGWHWACPKCDAIEMFE